MITQVNFHDFVTAFRAIRPDNFSTDGLAALFSHLEEWEESENEPLELDVIAICCDWTEHETARAAARDAGKLFTDEREAEEWLNGETIVINFNGGCIVADY